MCHEAGDWRVRPRARYHGRRRVVIVRALFLAFGFCSGVTSRSSVKDLQCLLQEGADAGQSRERFPSSVSVALLCLYSCFIFFGEL